MHYQTCDVSAILSRLSLASLVSRRLSSRPFQHLLISRLECGAGDRNNSIVIQGRTRLFAE